VELLSYYLKFQFAFPHKRNELIERAHEIQRGLLERMLADKETYVVYHPYPVGISDLFQAISLRLTVPETRVPPFTARLSPSFEEFART
jgi:hypothetical protein